MKKKKQLKKIEKNNKNKLVQAVHAPSTQFTAHKLVGNFTVLGLVFNSSFLQGGTVQTPF